MNKLGLLSLTIAVALVAASCTGTESTDSESAYDVVVAERDTALTDLTEAEQALSDAEAATETLAGDIETMTDEAERLRAEVAALTSRVAEAEAEAAAARDDASSAQAEIEALKLRFDPEIRAALEAEIATELARACDQAKEEYDRSVATIVSWSAGWESVTTRDTLIKDVEECSAAERSKTVEQREKERLASCESVDVDALEKNPDKYRGSCIHMWVRVVQYDSATGICTFRGEMASRKTSRWYDYDGNAMFSSSTDPVCPELDDIDNDDFVEVWATGAGTLSYDTTAGGTATATVWRIEKIDLWRKD